MGPKMIPGQAPYTDAELGTLYRMVADAAAGDPGEAGEATAYEGWRNQATWHASLILHNDYDLYRNLHDPARLATLREEPWTVDQWDEALQWAWRSVPADLRRATADMAGPIDWREIAAECAAEIAE